MNKLLTDATKIINIAKNKSKPYNFVKHRVSTAHIVVWPKILLSDLFSRAAFVKIKSGFG